jgi:hypothetical protein
MTIPRSTEQERPQGAGALRARTSFGERLLGAVTLDRRIYEEVEADRGATGQAFAVVLLASIAGGIGVAGLGVPDASGVAIAAIGALAGWVAWATLTYLIGTRLLPEPQTRANAGELLRTIAFASAPGWLRVLGVVPVIGLFVYAIASIWMLVAMVVAVRQALDYTSTGRAVAVCVVGWALSLTLAFVFGLFFAPTVS